MNNAAFEKTMENVKKNRYFKHVTTVPTTKKLSSVRTKLSYDKMLFKKFISNRNKQNKSKKKKKKTSLFRFIDSRI